MSIALQGQTPWLPGYVPYADRPIYTTLAEDHAVLAGCHAFYVDPEVGVDGVWVVSVGPEVSRVQFNVARGSQADFRRQHRSGGRDTYEVRTADLRDSYELAGLVATGRVMLIRLGLAEVWPGPNIVSRV